MLLRRRFRLLTPILGGKQNSNRDAPKRVFSHISKTPPKEDPDRVYLATDMPRWEWAFLEARDELSLGDVAVSCIMPSYWFSASKTSTYNRKRRRGSRMEVLKFESVPANHTFEMKFTLSRHIPPNTDGNGRFNRAPDEEEFDAMLSHIGEYLGMSEWGHSEQFGRFVLRPLLTTNDEPRTISPVGRETGETGTADVPDSKGRGRDDSPTGSPGSEEVSDSDVSSDDQTARED